MRRETRERIGPILALVALSLVIALGGYAGFRAFVVMPLDGEGGAQPDAGAAPAVAPRVVVWVKASKGEAQRAREGGWVQVVAGESLGEDEAIRTGAEGEIELDVEGAAVTVGERSELAVGGLTPALQRLELRSGRIAVEHSRASKPSLRIEAPHGEVTPVTGSGRFSMMVTPEALSVAAQEGEVDVRAQGETVRLPEGTRSVVHAGAPPSRPVPISPELLLKVARAGSRQPGCVLISGTASPGAEVRVDGAPAPVDVSGRFSVRLAPSASREQVEVAVREETGRTRVETLRCPLPSQRKRLDGFKMRWD